MKTTWHLALKDLRRFRWPFLMWLLLQASVAGVTLAHFGAAIEFSDRYRWQLLANLLAVIWILIGYLLAAAVVLEDPVNDSGAFWASRPISGVRLLQGKAVTLGLVFVILPILIWLPLWLYWGYEWGVIAKAIGGMTWSQTALTILAVMLATAAGSLSRFILATLVILVSYAVLCMYLAVYFHLPVEGGLTRLGAWVIVISGVVGIWMSYRCRGSRKGLIVSGLGLVSGLLVSCFPPGDPVVLLPRRQADLPGLERLQVQFGGMGSTANSSGRDTRSLMLHVKCRGLAKDIALSGGRAEVNLGWSDGTRTVLHGLVQTDTRARAGWSALGLTPVAADAETERHRQDLHSGSDALKQGRRRFSNLGDERAPAQDEEKWEPMMEVSVQIPLAVGSRLLNEAPEWSVRLHLNVYRPELLVEAPLRPGIVAGGKNTRLHVVRVRPPEKRKAGAEEDLSFGMVEVAYVDAPSMPRAELYALNRSRSTGRYLFAGGTPFGLSPLAESFRCTLGRIPVTSFWRDGGWELAPDWQESVTVAAVGFRFAGEKILDLAVGKPVLPPMKY